MSVNQISNLYNFITFIFAFFFFLSYLMQLKLIDNHAILGIFNFLAYIKDFFTILSQINADTFLTKQQFIFREVNRSNITVNRYLKIHLFIYNQHLADSFQWLTFSYLHTHAVCNLFILCPAVEKLYKLYQKTKKESSMKPKGLYEIHALIGHCHLHNKKKSLYSITLKMGSKVFANTDYKMPINDDINFNTQLILKIDKTLYQGPGKLSIIVTMLTQEKQKKIIGSSFANFKQKGLQSFKVSQCSCKDKAFQVNVEFEVVNIQNHNNNPNNNKFQSPNNSQMKDLKKALTISRQKQLVKSSRAKQGTGTKSPVQKTQSKLNKQKIQKQLKQEMSPDLSSLTTKITPHFSKLSQQTKQMVSQMRDKINDLEVKVRESSCKQKTNRRQITVMQNEIQILKSQNECLIEILKFEEEKSSAAISYIQFLTQKIGQKQLMNNDFHQYCQLIKTIKINDKNDTSSAIKDHKNSIKPMEEYSFEFKPIQQKEQITQQNTQRLTSQIEQYKITIQELRQKIIDLESDQVQKSDNITYLQTEITKISKQNNSLRGQIDKLQKSINDYEFQIKSFHIQNSALDAKTKQLQKILSQMNIRQIKSGSQIQQISKLHNISIKQNAELKQKILDLENKITKLKEYQNKYQNLKKQYDQIKILQTSPKTPFESQIVLKKSRFDDGEDIQNIINQMNGCAKEINNKQLMLSSRRRVDDQSDHFLARNKSASLLNDLQQGEDSQDPKTSQTSENKYKPIYRNKDQVTTKSSKKVSIPQHKKQIQKYNYEYDIDSLNYFNNFEQNHQICQSSGVEQNNSCEIEVDLGGRV